MEFRYLSQAPAITSQTRDRIQVALDKFHHHKQAILDLGLHWGKTVMNHFRIPKLELMQSMVMSIRHVGCLLQWSADTTEHTHIEVVKDPTSMTNHHDYDAQICRVLDHDEKCCLFATTLHLQMSQNDELDGLDTGSLNGSEGGDDDDVGQVSLGDVLRDLWSTKHQSTNFFMKAAMESTVGNSLPPRTIIAGLTAMHLNVEPTHQRQSIDDVAEDFGLPDLCGALANYVRHQRRPHEKKFHVFGGARQLGLDAELPFSDLQIWHKVHLQQKSYHLLNELGPMFTVNAHPPDRTWKYSWYDATILQVDPAHQWPLSSLTGTLFFYSKTVALTQNLLGHSFVLV